MKNSTWMSVIPVAMVEIVHGFWTGSSTDAREEGAEVSRAPTAALCCSLKGSATWAATKRQQSQCSPWIMDSLLIFWRYFLTEIISSAPNLLQQLGFLAVKE